MLITIRDLVNQSWNLYKDNFKLFAKIAAWLLIPAVVFSFLPTSGIKTAVLAPLSLFSSVVFFLLGLFISVALTFAAGALLKKEKITLKNIYNLSYAKLLSYLWVCVLSGAAIAGAPAILIILGAILQIGLFIDLGLIFVFVPGIIFAVWFSFGSYILIFEDIKGARALGASKTLTKDYFWSVLWRWFASYFIYGLLATFAIFILVYIIGIIVGAPGAGFAEVTPWWSALISNFVSLFALPPLTIIGVILYNGLKKEKSTITKQ